MADSIDYCALAAGLRRSRQVQHSRLESERAARESDPRQVALDDALDVLQSGAADDVLAEVEKHLRAGVAVAAQRPEDPYSIGVHPNPIGDCFLDGVLGYYRDVDNVGLDPSKLPQAVVTSLAAHTAAHGFVDAKAAKALGPLAIRLLARVSEARAEVRAHQRDGSAKNTGKYSGLSMDATRKVAVSKGRDGYLARMPVVRDLLAMGKDRSLGGFSLASVQHLFPSAVGLYDALFSSGLSPERTHVGGKFYSANPNTIVAMESRGLRVHMSASDDDAFEVDAEDAVRAMAKDELRAMFHGVDPKTAKGRSFLLLDDGGKLIHALHEYFPQYAHLCVAVEQTTRGLQVIDDMKKAGRPLLCPVVNMAGCQLKREVESPLIAASVVWHLTGYLEKLGLGHLKPTPAQPRTAVVAGFGATGTATAKALSRAGYHVVVTDTDDAQMRAATAAGFEALPSKEAMARADVFVGSSGRGTLTQEQWGLLKPGAVLVNAASGNHELGVAHLGPRALEALDPQRSDDKGAVTTSFAGRRIAVGRTTDDSRLEHRVVHVAGADGTDRELLFLRGGSVVNMEHDLPPEYRQIIIGMLLAGCFQAANAEVPELVEFDHAVQDFLRLRFAKALEAAGLSLDEPDLDAVAGPWG